MAEDLWKLRKKRGMTVKQLANKSGVPAFSIHEYEHGQPIRIADLARLAKALFVDEIDIKIQSDPMQTAKSAPAQEAARPAKEEPEKKRAAPKPKPPPPPASPGQINHLLNLGRALDEDEEAVTQAAGKPLTELTRVEIKPLLKEYTERAATAKSAEEALRPDGTRRTRAHLPEAVDEFELQYLQERQEQGELVTFKLLSGEELTGKIIGFSPYQIMIEQRDQSEATINKLALVYYACVPMGESAK